MQAVSFHFCNMRVTDSVLCIKEGRLQIHCSVDKRNANHTFTAGSKVVLFDILQKRFIKHLQVLFQRLS